MNISDLLGGIKGFKFTIPGKPKAKARPRVTKKGVFTPKSTKDYELYVKACYKEQKGLHLGNSPVMLTVTAFFSIPKKISKQDRIAMITGEIQPTKRPDGDNIYKIIADALNGAAYKDDSQIVIGIFMKRYGEKPRVEVVLTKVS